MIYDEFTVKKAKIIHPNFSGIESIYNPPKCRNFAMIINEDLATVLKNDGWNVRLCGEKPYLKVAVQYKPIGGICGPTIILVDNGKKTYLTEETVSILDTVNIKNAEATICGYRWHIDKHSEVKAYLKYLKITAK